MIGGHNEWDIKVRGVSDHCGMGPPSSRHQGGLYFLCCRRLSRQPRPAPSGSNLTFESEEGFPADSSRASLAHANRNFHHSQVQ